MELWNFISSYVLYYPASARQSRSEALCTPEQWLHFNTVDCTDCTHQDMTKQFIFRQEQDDWNLIISAGHSCRTLHAFERRCPIFSPPKVTFCTTYLSFPTSPIGSRNSYMPCLHIWNGLAMQLWNDRKRHIQCSHHLTTFSQLYAVWIRLALHFAFATRIFHDSQALVAKGTTRP